MSVLQNITHFLLDAMVTVYLAADNGQIVWELGQRVHPQAETGNLQIDEKSH